MRRGMTSPRPYGSAQMTGGLRIMENQGMGWKMFAGLMILVAGIFNVFDGIVGVSQTNYITRNTGGQLPITNNVKTWSWVVLIIGAVMILAAFLIFVGDMFGRI